MKVYLDDERNTPDGWHRVYTAPEAIELIKTGVVTEISLDHDLGEVGSCVGTGYEVACYIEQGAHMGSLGRLKWSIHSANPVGRKNMQAALESADRAWDMAEMWARMPRPCPVC